MAEAKESSLTRIRDALEQLPEGMDPVQVDAIIERLRLLDAAFRRKEESWYDMLADKGRDARERPEVFDLFPTEEEEKEAGVGEDPSPPGPSPWVEAVKPSWRSDAEPVKAEEAVEVSTETAPEAKVEAGEAPAEPGPESPPEPEPAPVPASEPKAGAEETGGLASEFEEKQAALKKALEGLAALRRPKEEGGTGA